MDATDWFLIILTFFTGLLIGAFLYVSVFKPTYAPEDLNIVEDEAMEFSVAGRSYGGIRTGFIHPSFRVLEDGSFIYVTGAAEGVEANTYEAVLPPALTNDLVGAVRRANLSLFEESAEKDCRIAVDGVDYRYQVILAGETYLLDTCTTALPYESELNESLEAVWSYFRDPASYQGRAQDKGSIADQLADYLNDQIGVPNDE